MKPIRSAFRYPGSKEKIADHILRWFPERVTYSIFNADLPCYCEPFIGCGAMAVKVLPLLPRSARVILADKDYGIICLWRSVLNAPEELASRFHNFTPSVQAFDRFKALDGSRDDDPVAIGFRKFALHQMSFSGLGAKAGGPIGGKKQRSDYAVDCRYRPGRHSRDVAIQHRLLKQFKSVEIIHGDFQEALDLVPHDGFAYLDPPYFLKGGELYAHNMEREDHERLASVLAFARYDWTLSYDDHPTVKQLYAEWADINEFKMTATIDTKRGSKSRRKNNELVITKREGV